MKLQQTIAALCALVLLAGNIQAPSDTPGYWILHRFKGGTDGADPGDLIAHSGILYGTTSNGGAGCDCGTFFEMNAVGIERVLYRNKREGDGPGDLTAVQGTFYSMKRDDVGGRVSEVNMSGAEHVLHSFNGGTDGKYPSGGLIAMNGLLYGATEGGGGLGCHGPDGCGTVFEVSASGTERVLYRFEAGSDGATPEAGLVALDGKLYGTTSDRGDPRCECGTVFEVRTSGAERVIYRFKGGTDGRSPLGNLVAVNGKLYGTTEDGGSICNRYTGCGTVFEVSPSGKERVLYRFKGGTDGANPESNLVALNDNLYGTTGSGGDSRSCTAPAQARSWFGCGTVFEVNVASGAERVLHRFEGGMDGAHPQNVIAMNGALYGTTQAGGDSSSCIKPEDEKDWNGCGTVFELKP